MARIHQTLVSLFEDIADSIREKKGETENAQIWDEEWELGVYDVNTGTKTTDPLRIRSKDFIEVLPNTTYNQIFGTATTDDIRILYYKQDKIYISAENWLRTNNTFTTPNDCYYITFFMASAYGTTYHNDISINYPSTDTSYHPYTKKVADDFPSEIDSITLESLLPSDIGVVDLGTLNYTLRISNDRYFYSTTGISDIEGQYDFNKQINAWSVMYTPKAEISTFVDKDFGYYGAAIGSKTIDFVNNDYTNATDFKNAMNGVLLFYKKAQ